MGYMKIENLYKNQDIMMFREVYAMEKVHGTSAHISYRADRNEKLQFYSGGAKHTNFVALFNQDDLLASFESLGVESAVVFGEAYGGSVQKMSHLYGNDLRFIVFEVKIGDYWLSVPDADKVAQDLGLEFVPYNKISCTPEALTAERDRPSRVAERRGCGGPDQIGEGLVVRPLIELSRNNGKRIIIKYKTEAFSERSSKSDAKIDPAKKALQESAASIADEWVTEMRLIHVLDKMPCGIDGADMSHTKEVIRAMINDIAVEAGDEIDMSKAVLSALGRKTGVVLRGFLQKRISA